MVLPFGVFIAVLLRKPATQPRLIYLGAISYSVYLFQDAVQLVLSSLVSAGRYPMAYVIAVVLITIALASATYRFLERPMIAFGRRAMSPIRAQSQAA
jgi:peptidoglycan/LPS O-acetylase OafA/YrhL